MIVEGLQPNLRTTYGFLAEHSLLAGILLLLKHQSHDGDML